MGLASAFAAHYAATGGAAKYAGASGDVPFASPSAAQSMLDVDGDRQE